MRHTRRLSGVLAAAVVLSTSACSGSDSQQDAADSVEIAASSTAGDSPIDAPGDTGEAVEVEAQPANELSADVSSATAPVDVCGIIDAATLGTLLNTEFEPGQATAAHGSLLGGCDFRAVNPHQSEVGTLSISARPVDQWGATIDYMHKSDPESEDVANVGDAALFSKVGLTVRMPDKRYMIQVLGFDNSVTALGQEDSTIAANALIDAA